MSENNETTAKSNSVGSAEPIAVMQHKKTTGEKWYQGLTLVTNFVGTFISSGLIAFGVLRNKWYNKTVTDPMAEKIGRKQANTINNTFWLMQGGNLMLIPMHVMEKSKKPIVQFFNQKFGKAGEIEAYEQRHAEIPKRSWGDFIKGRIVAFLVVWGSFTAAEKLWGEKMGNFVNGTGEKFSSLLKKDPYQKDADGNIKMDKDLDGNEFKVPTITNEIGRMFSLDFFATVSAVSILDVAAGFFSGKKKSAVTPEQKMTINPANDNRDQTPAPAVATPTAPTAENKRDEAATPAEAAPQAAERKLVEEVQPKAKPESRENYSKEREKEKAAATQGQVLVTT